MPYALCCHHWLNSEPSRLDIHGRRSSSSPRLEVKHTGGFRVAGGESESPGPGWTRASAARRPAPSPPNPPPRPPPKGRQVRTRFRRAPGLREPVEVGVGQPVHWALRDPQPRGTGSTPGVQRHSPARGGPRPYLPLRTRPRVARIVCPAPSAAAATTRLKGPGPERPPGACSAAGGGGGRRAPEYTRFRSHLPQIGVSRALGCAASQVCWPRRGGGRWGRGHQASLRWVPKVFRPPNRFPGRRGQRGRRQQGVEPRVHSWSSEPPFKSSYLEAAML
ncbi:splicing factor, proline- and glutamine-rich-like [Neofelis nebulosa]|uniref:splicing factor, proline- and glutamine-rich-like n=1 Tax=Neofelis nebulosa TaxID=61452 RepID=UPI002729AF00|nr:splicing factor, proline- and glutamine-rich-like [Neofelis nebulosa]